MHYLRCVISGYHEMPEIAILRKLGEILQTPKRKSQCKEPVRDTTEEVGSCFELILCNSTVLLMYEPWYGDRVLQRDP